MGVESKHTNQTVFLDFEIRGFKVGRVVLELYTKIAPQTCENFRALCTGEYGVGKSGYPLHLKGSLIHKVVRNVLIQGGDITNHNGSGGDTIYGRVYTDQINPNGLKFEEAGVLGLAKSVDHPEEHTSQFFITVDACPHLEGGNIAFGKVLKGLEIIRVLSCQESDNNVPVEKIEICNCGEIKSGEDWGYIENDGTVDVYPPYPADWELPSTGDDVKAATQAAEDIKDSGNYFFRKKEYFLASRKYEKALRYLDWANKLNGEEVERDQYTACLLNLGASKLMLKEFSEARTLCSAVISRNPKSIKAFFRRGKANFGLCEYEAAIQDLKTANRLEQNKYIEAEIGRVERARKKYTEEAKKTYAAMLK